MTIYRSPIITVLGHIDHGKTTLLDRIRNTKVAETEVGNITQSIGSTFVPMSIIKDICSKMFKKFEIEPMLQGLLFIDTPGHEAFITMRERGGYITDIAILLVDITEGFMPQTNESLELLKKLRTPFVLVLNKIDKIFGWTNSSKNFLENFETQREEVKIRFERRFYEIASELEKNGFKGERFDRVSDFSKEVAIIPISAKTGEGISDLLFVLTGLAEKFLKKKLIKTEESKGMVLEVKDIKGLGKTADVIIYDGEIEVGDYVIFFGKEATITKVRSLLIPRRLQDLRTEKRFEYVKRVEASHGVKILGQNLEEVIPGSELRVVKTIEDAERLKKEAKLLKSDIYERKDEGIILKADTLGGLEALRNVFKDFKIKYGDVGQISKEDVIDASINKDLFLRVIVCFNIRPSDEIKKIAKEREVEIISSDIIYDLIDRYKIWREEKKRLIEEERLKDVVFPSKIKILPGYVFRASRPAILGCEVLVGIIKPSYELFKPEKGNIINLGKIKQIQDQGKAIEVARKGNKVAISITEAVFGRNVFENDVLYTNISVDDYLTLKQYEKILTEDEKLLLEEIRSLKKL